MKKEAFFAILDEYFESKVYPRIQEILEEIIYTMVEEISVANYNKQNLTESANYNQQKSTTNNNIQQSNNVITDAEKRKINIIAGIDTTTQPNEEKMRLYEQMINNIENNNNIDNNIIEDDPIVNDEGYNKLINTDYTKLKKLYLK